MLTVTPHLFPLIDEQTGADDDASSLGYVKVVSRPRKRNRQISSESENSSASDRLPWTANPQPNILLPSIPRLTETFNPWSYTCQGFDPNSAYFDGASGTKSEHFVIDLQSESMEKEPDVRPYFFFVGATVLDGQWPCALGTPLLELEESCVKAGREFLKAEKQAGRGYYIPYRPYADANRAHSDWETMPWGPMMSELLIGEQNQAIAEGFEVPDYRSMDYELDNVIKTNVRVPLLPREFVLASPGNPGWDGMIRHLYGPEIHPVRVISTCDHPASCRSAKFLSVGRSDYTVEAFHRYWWDGEFNEVEWDDPWKEKDMIFRSPPFPH